MQSSETIVNLAKALALVQAELKPVKKDSKNPFFKSDYASYESVKESAQPSLSKHGLSVLHVPVVTTGGEQALECVLLHNSGEWISGVYVIHPEKNTPQGVGSAITYAKRYSFESLVGIVTTDDDGEGAMDRRPAQLVRPQAKAEAANAAAKLLAKHGVPVEKSLTAESPLLDLCEYKIPMGKKHKGKRLGDVPVEELNSFLDWLKDQPEINDAGQEFLLIGNAYLDRLNDTVGMARG